MSDETLLRMHKAENCCRLCLAPDNECISILNSYAADKEPLVTKIHNCVSIRVTPNDRLSLRICHACISYLNSWQSFKNRCIQSQVKQSKWLDADKRLNLSHNNNNSDGDRPQQYNQQQVTQDQTDYPSSLLEGISTLKKRKSLTVYPVPPCEIKDEPIDPDEIDYGNKLDESDDMVDPTMFLERTEEVGDEPIMGPDFNTSGELNPSMDDVVKEAACRACNLKFSTRANARRHERNLHPNLFQLSTSTPHSAPVTKPTANFVAALQLQRTGAATSEAKFRQEVINAFNNYENGYDYDNPEKYQHLLTDEKIIFIKQNEEFLKQYQTMTCKCCDRYYTTYKNFMAHMRKKYSTLPRNLCFSCLKLNDSKALFISHLKRRNCINLYKVLQNLTAKNSSFASAVAATAASVPEKLRAKELLVNKMYECKLCPKSFRLKMEFRSHVYDKHGDKQKKDVGPNQCTFCGLAIEDPAERKRHHKNLDCIASLRCVTCEAIFDNHQKFLDHVYETHLTGFDPAAFTGNVDASDVLPGKKSGGRASSSADESRSSQATTSTSMPIPPAQKSQYFSRMPQACPICGQQYNNYNNVLRHMESKHPDQLPQTYKCVKCGVGYPRLSNLREHMVNVHGSEKARHTSFDYIVNSDAVKIPDHATYSGRYDYVMKDLMSITNGQGLIDGSDGENAAKKLRLDSSASNGSHQQAKECKICNATFSNNIGLSNHMRSHNSAAAQQNSVAAALAKAKSTNALTITTVPPVGENFKPLAVPPALAGLGLQARNPEQRMPTTALAGSHSIFNPSSGDSPIASGSDKQFRRMRCRHCQRRFSSKKALRFHMMNDHHIPHVHFIKCTLCEAEFACEKGLNVHMIKVHQKEARAVAEQLNGGGKQYECNICFIVYRSEDQLSQHKKAVHGVDDVKQEQQRATPAGANASVMDVDESANLSGISTPVSAVGGPSTASATDVASAAPLYWYQCKYCPSNFNTNKKLAIHINSHDEFDSNDYSCKDCGNVYSGRKSLWVHRYKKHPQVAQPAECVLCKKVFFDPQMLEHHIPTCNRKPITATGAMVEQPVFRHRTGDDEEDDRTKATATSSVTNATAASALADIKIPEVACTICGQLFTDQDRFSKHMQVHEMELYTDNPLAAMFDTGPADPNQFYLDRVNENGEYACDLCSKAFTQMTALKVHRKWHFRGDSKQIPTESNDSMTSFSGTTTNNQPRLQVLPLASLMGGSSASNTQLNHSILKSQKRKRELKCEYCPSTFISNNNLRRHIYELHKDEVADLPEPPKIEIDPYMCCRRCNKTFEDKQTWIDHKVGEARMMRPFGPFQWGCDLCGTYVSRKEKLIHHIYNHMFNLVKKGDTVILTVEPPKNKKQVHAQLHEGKLNRNGPEVKVLQHEIASLSTSPSTSPEKPTMGAMSGTLKTDDVQDEKQESRDSQETSDSQDSEDESQESDNRENDDRSHGHEERILQIQKDHEEDEDDDDDIDDDDGDDEADSEEEEEENMMGRPKRDNAVDSEDDVDLDDDGEDDGDGDVDDEEAADPDIDEDYEGLDEENDNAVGEYDGEGNEGIQDVNEDANDGELSDDDDDLGPIAGFDDGEDIIVEDDGDDTDDTNPGGQHGQVQISAENSVDGMDDYVMDAEDETDEDDLDDADDDIVMEGGNSKPFECVMCTDTFATKQELHAHAKTHF